MKQPKFGVHVNRLKGTATVIMGDGRTRQVIGENEYGYPALLFGYQDDELPLVLDVVGKTEKELGLKVGVHFHSEGSLTNCIKCLQTLKDEYYGEEKQK